jgi:hypothetical protein
MLTIQHLRFHVRARAPVRFASAPGSALRGTFYHALSSLDSATAAWLLDLDNPRSARGQDAPHPITFEPPAPHLYEHGSRLAFGVTLIGQAQDLLPHVALAARRMGEIGIGQGRGQFVIEAISEYSPVLRVERAIMERGRILAPTLQVTSEQIAAAARRMDNQTATLRFLTPVQIKANHELQRRLAPRHFFGRLVERVDALATLYGDGAGVDWRGVYLDVTRAAETLSIGIDTTRWKEATSHNIAENRKHDLSGLVGTLRLDGTAIKDLREWLLWGQSLHVGRGATKGNGWYAII